MAAAFEQEAARPGGQLAIPRGVFSAQEAVRELRLKGYTRSLRCRPFL